jgi:zinc protease
VRTATLALGALAALCTTARAQMISAQPSSVQPTPRLALERYTLPNGLTVVLQPDHSAPVVAVRIEYHVGSADELPGRTGFAHLFEHIMFMGSEHVPLGHFDQWLEQAGANNNAYTTHDVTSYYEWMPSNALPLALWLDADRMGWLLPTMTLERVDVQRDVVKNERRERIDNAPYGRANETILAALYPSADPYSWSVIGSMTDLSAASLSDVQTFFKTYYAPNNATLVVVGDFVPDSARHWISRDFGSIPRGSVVPTRPTVSAFTLAHDTTLTLQDRVQLPRVYYAWHGVKVYSQDDAALDLLAYILAGGHASRLYQTLVHDRQLAQDVGAQNQDFRLDGLFTISVTPKPSVAPAAVDSVLDTELSRVIDSGVTDAELTRARNVQRTSMLDRLAGVTERSDQLAYYDYVVGTPDYVSQDLARYEHVTLGDIQRVARTYLGAHKVVLTVVPERQPAA